MKPERDIRQFFRKAAADTEPGMDQKVLAKVLAAHETTGSTGSIPNRSNVRITIMRSPITRSALAAAVLVAVLLGLSQLGGTSGVAWAEVAQKVNASRGVIFRVRTTGSDNPSKDWPNECTMTRRSPKYSRTDWHRAGRPNRMVSFNLDARTMLWLDHDRKAYATGTMAEEDVQSIQNEWSDPKALLDLLMSGGYRELGRKTIDGVVCEGIETTDPAAARVSFPVKSLTARMWVSVETGYPVLGEIEIVRRDNSLLQTSKADQFQWDVEIEPDDVEPPIPSDYRLMD